MIERNNIYFSSFRYLIICFIIVFGLLLIVGTGGGGSNTGGGTDIGGESGSGDEPETEENYESSSNGDNGDSDISPPIYSTCAPPEAKVQDNEAFAHNHEFSSTCTRAILWITATSTTHQESKNSYVEIDYVKMDEYPNGNIFENDLTIHVSNTCWIQRLYNGTSDEGAFGINATDAVECNEGSLSQYAGEGLILKVGENGNWDYLIHPAFNCRPLSGTGYVMVEVRLRVVGNAAVQVGYDFCGPIGTKTNCEGGASRWYCESDGWQIVKVNPDVLPLPKNPECCGQCGIDKFGCE